MGRLKELKLEDMEHVARGAAFLGTGGGGDPYIGRLLAEQSVEEKGPVKVVSVNEVDPDWTVLPLAYIGAPTVAVEKLIDVDALELAFSVLERQIGHRADAVISAEMGGCNSMIPITLAARRGIPLIDADGMGRAFPELPMGTFNICGISCTPLVLANEHGESTIINSRDVYAAEKVARQLVVEMGGSVAMSCYSMSGYEAKHASVPGTLSAALEIGRAIADGRRHGDPTQKLLDYLAKNPTYGACGVLFEGKIVDVHRETESGFASGSIDVEAFSSSTEVAKVEFQNEYLVLRCGSSIRAVVPDLICILDRDSAEPITTEGLRYGQRISIIGVGAPEILLTKRGLATVGPEKFGLENDYQSIEFS